MDRATSQASSALVAEPFAGDGNLQIVQQLAEALAILGQIDILRIGADDGHARGLQRQRQRQRSLPAELHDHAVGLFGVADVQHFFERQRLEVQTVAGVVIGRDGLRIAVDHDRLDAELLQRERRVAAAVIELDSLADAIGAAAQDHHFLAIGGRGFALRFVARIKIRREAFELGRAGVHAIEHRRDAQFLAPRAHRQRGSTFQARASVESDRPSRLSRQHLLARHAVERQLAAIFFQIHHLAHLPQEPRIDGGERVHLLFGIAALERVANVTQPVRIRRDQARLDQLVADTSSRRRICRFRGSACPCPAPV